MNPIGNVFCNRCNARLLPIEMQLPEQPKPAEEPPVSVKGISLPTLQTAKEGTLEPEELPDWLLELTEPSPGKPTKTPGVEEPAPANQSPDWLSDLTNETTNTAGSETPDWFADLLEDETVESAGDEMEPEESALEELPDWLSDLTPEEPAPAEGIANMAPPPSDWAVVTPDVIASSSPDRAAEPRAELPDWLLATAVPTPSGKTPASQPLPKWLSKNAVKSAPVHAAGGAPGTERLPAWLLKGVEPATASAAPRRPVTEPAPSTFPGLEPQAEPEKKVELDWLADLYSAEEPEPESVRPAPEPREEATPAADEPASSLPDWLMGIYEEEDEPQVGVPTATTAPKGTEPAGGLPDWLMGISGEEETEAEAAAETDEPASELPDWLAGIYGEEEVEPQPTVPGAEPEEAAAEEREAGGLPDWLAGIYSEAAVEEPPASAFSAEPEKEEIAPDTAVPDWLAGIMAEEPVPAQHQEPSEDEEIEPEMRIPDWLAGPETEAPSTEEKQPSPFASDASIFTEATPEKAQAGPSATPDWLKGVAPADDESALTPAQPAFIPSELAPGERDEEYEEPVLESGEIPDWLKGLAPAAAPSPVEEEAAFIERMSEDESLVRAKVPSWLQGLRPPGTGPLPPLPEMMVPGADVPPPEEGGLVRAEIPDWVQQLRPAPSAEGETGKKQVLEPAETEGPLAGLRGLIPDGSVLDMPTDYQPAPPPTIPDSVVAQAQLWQQLLEQPRSVQRPVAQHRARSGKGQATMRLIVAVILLAVTILGLLWDDAPLSQALSRPHIERLSRAIDTLEPGDTVIVAVEYGPAEAGEMAILAEAVMQHLADREAEVMLVSTLPEGAGLIQGLLEPLALVNRLPAGQTTYLPGSSNGVAQFLNEPTEAEMIIVLAGRAERLRWWIEQNNATQATASAQSLPMAIAVNAATAPVMTPYLETSPVTGWIAGLPDVVAYQQFRGLSSSILDSQLNALMLAHWAALALLLFGLFYYLALGKKGAS